MNTIIIIVLLMCGTTGYNKIRSENAPKYWDSNFFIESELPKELKGKPIQYIDSVFKAKRK
jgi:hypothetical protein